MENQPALTDLELTALLRANTAPDASQRISIRRAISSEQESLQDALTVGEGGAMQELPRRITALSSLLAPIRRLPPEIVSSIFIDPYLHRLNEQSSSAFVGRGADPIMQVSFHWRAVALSTPQLWSTFAISLAGNERVARLLAIYLERSKGCALSVKICARHAIHSGMLQALLDNCERWVSLHLEIDPDDYCLFLPARNRLPRLEKLSLHSNTTRISTTEITDVFEEAPRLRRVEVLIPAHCQLPKLPLTQITTLSVSAANIDLAEKCLNLRILSCTSPHKLPPGLVPVIVSNISTLYAAPAILQVTTTSNLVSLCLHDQAVCNRPWSQLQFSSFIQRSRCSLQILFLDAISVRGNDLLALLRLVPTLKALYLHCLRPNAVTDKVIETLTLGNRNEAVPTLPMLTSLYISGSYLFSNAVLVDMLESRTGGENSTLQQVELHLQHRKFGPGELSRLRAFKAMEIRLCVKALNAENEYIDMV
ncbi:hypothetical protein C8R43DRAFT_1118305 [Mycena crocata]|nr:hypothetical protein C8R43DRAFT_1118305 [Mycena crocata]